LGKARLNSIKEKKFVFLIFVIEMVKLRITNMEEMVQIPFLVVTGILKKRKLSL
jgi:hypothetical protein